MILRSLLLTLLWLPLLLPANSPEELRQNYRSLQTSYHQQVRDLEEQQNREQTALLNRFILSLVRMEQQLREDGNLEGVVQTRALRDELLEEPVFPQADESRPPPLQQAIQTLLTERAALLQTSQTRLESVNRDFARRIEPVMRDLTRAGDFETAREILTARRMILETLGETETPLPPPTFDFPASGDPNVLAFSLEPAGLARMPGITPRRSQIPYKPVVNGTVDFTPKTFRFRGGRLHIPEEALRALLFQVKQNQMLTLELGFQTHQARQWAGPDLPPIPILYLGNSPKESNLTLTHEGARLVLYLRTDRPPESSPLHRIPLGPVGGGRMEHLAITYRGGELTIYRDGTETRKIRADIGGGFENWEPYPLVLGGTPSPDPAQRDPSWSGEIVFFYLHSSHETARGISSSYSRFADFVTRPLPSP